MGVVLFLKFHCCKKGKVGLLVTGVNTAEHECKNDTKVRCDYTDYGINNIFLQINAIFLAMFCCGFKYCTYLCVHNRVINIGS